MNPTLTVARNAIKLVTIAEVSICKKNLIRNSSIYRRRRSCDNFRMSYAVYDFLLFSRHWRLKSLSNSASRRKDVIIQMAWLSDHRLTWTDYLRANTHVALRLPFTRLDPGLTYGILEELVCCGEVVKGRNDIKQVGKAATSSSLFLQKNLDLVLNLLTTHKHALI